MGGWLARCAALLALALCLLVATGSVAADEQLVVIVHPSNPTTRMSATELYDVFTSSRQTWAHGGRVLAFNLPPRTTVREQFDRAVFAQDAEGVARFWIDQRVRGGPQPPRAVPTPDLVLRLVESVPGAVGYVPLASIAGRAVRVVARVSAAEVRAP